MKDIKKSTKRYAVMMYTSQVCVWLMFTEYLRKRINNKSLNVK